MARVLMATLLVLTLSACGARAPAAGRDAIEQVSAAWKAAFNAGDAAAVTALYGVDAVLAAPGVPPVRGRAAIGDYFARTLPGFATAGVTVTDEPLGESATSGNLGFQWKRYAIVDRSGAVVDRGKLLTLFRRTQGQWQIIGDTWNSDLPASPPSP